MQDLANLEVLEVGESNNEQALVDLQLSLAAYTQVVVKNLCDSIPKLVYAQLVGKVCTMHLIMSALTVCFHCQRRCLL